MSSTITPTKPVRAFNTGQIGLLITLTVESVFFMTVLVAYAALREQSSWAVSHTLARLSIPLVNSGILFLSVITAWLSTREIRRGNPSGLKLGLTITLLFGLLFVAGQVFEFSHAGLRIDDPTFGGVFFTLMVFHAIHVLAGVVFLALNLLRTSMGDFTAERHGAIQLGGWFWYYVAGVWAVLFTALYLV